MFNYCTNTFNLFVVVQVLLISFNIKIFKYNNYLKVTETSFSEELRQFFSMSCFENNSRITLFNMKRLSIHQSLSLHQDCLIFWLKFRV